MHLEQLKKADEIIEAAMRHIKDHIKEYKKGDPTEHIIHATQELRETTLPELIELCTKPPADVREGLGLIAEQAITAFDSLVGALDSKEENAQDLLSQLEELHTLLDNIIKEHKS